MVPGGLRAFQEVSGGRRCVPESFINAQGLCRRSIVIQGCSRFQGVSRAFQEVSWVFHEVLGTSGGVSAGFRRVPGVDKDF